MLELAQMHQIRLTILAFLTICLLGACQSTDGNALGMRMDYSPTIAFMGGTEAFSTKPEPFSIGIVYEVDRGYIDRVDVELDGNPAGSHYIVDRVNRGKFQFDVDASALLEGEHELRITAFQGARYARTLKSSTNTLIFHVIK